MNGFIGMCGVVALLLVVGGAIGLADRKKFNLRWLLVAALLVAVNDALLTRGYGLLPNLLPDAQWNWQGKLLALGLTLAIAALPVIGWRRAGFTLAQQPGSLKASIPAVVLYCGFFLALALVFPNGATNTEELAFQLTMPGLEEELFYRGLLLLALDRAFTARVRFLGIDWGWGAILSCLLFGMTHAFGYSGVAFSLNGFSFDAMTMALTAVPSLLGVWLRVRTGSVLLPIVVHNFGNSIFLLL